MKLYLYIGIFIVAVTLASVAQVLLKKAAMKPRKTFLFEYVNAGVILAYVLLFITSGMAVFAYQEIPLSFGVMMNALSYVYAMIFGKIFFHEQLSQRKILGGGCIVFGIVLYACS